MTTTKEKILDVTEELIENNGYANISTRTIAKEVGISVGTLYHHFPRGKMEIVIKIAEKYSQILGMLEFLADPNADPRVWLRKNLELNQKKKAFITAMEIEAMTRPDEVQSLINENIKKQEETQKSLLQAFKMMEKFAGKKISIERATTMQQVLKAIMRRHVVFGNLFGSDDEFLDLFFKIAKAVAED